MTYLKLHKLRIVSLLFFSFYLIQWILPVKISRLIELQENDDFKFWSGLLLITLFSCQWILTYARVVSQKKGEKFLKIIHLHKLTGIISPLIYFIHSANPTYGLLMILTVVFLFNHLIANFNLEKFTVRQFNVWIGIHLFLSVAIMLLAIIHIVIVYQYK